MLLLIYRILSVLFLPLLVIYIFVRAFKGKEDFSRLKERFGFVDLEKFEINPDRKIVWIHAVSVGETNSALIFLDEILKLSSDIVVVFTTTTLTSAKILNAKINSSPNYKDRVIHQFLPVDSYFIVRKFVKKLNPKVIFFIESEIWPNFVSYASTLAIPTFLINARISKKSFLRWSLIKTLGFNIFNYFTVIFVQSKNDIEKFTDLSDLPEGEVLFCGNLKSQAVILKFNEAELDYLKDQIKDRKFWLAASTHKGEEEIILEAHKKLKEKFPDLLTIIVPRHPNRADEICELLKEFNFSQRSKNQDITTQNEIYLADSLGEMGLFYRLADFALICGSLKDNIGGHNPFEAIKLECSVLSGKYVYNFKDIYEELEKNQGCIMVDGEEIANNIAQNVEKLLNDKSQLITLSENALQIIAKEGNVVGKIISSVQDFILE